MPERKASISETIGMLHNRHRKYTRPSFEKMGLFRGQPPLLLLLSKKDGMTQKEIASALNLAPPTVNKMVRRMEQGGFIHKRSDPEDLRITRILLSSKGLALIDQIREVIDEEEKAISALYTPEEKILLLKLLSRITEVYDGEPEKESDT